VRHKARQTEIVWSELQAGGTMHLVLARGRDETAKYVPKAATVRPQVVCSFLLAQHIHC
jgi:hypothetical protein